MTVLTDYTAILAYPEADYLRWNNPAAVGTAVVVTYSFTETADLPSTASYNPYGASSYSSFTEAQRQNFRDAAAEWAAAGGVIFVEVETGGMIEAFASAGASAGGWANYPVTTESQVSEGKLVVNRSDPYNEGGYGYLTLMHELGHALGFEHPHEGDTTLDPSVNNLAHTVMTYNITSSGGVYTSDLGIFDIQAVEHLYGAVQDTSAWVMEFVGSVFNILMSSASETIMGINAQNRIVGYSGHDVIYGREQADTLHGGGGNDWLYGQHGVDILVGGAGTDQMFGGGDDDRLSGQDDDDSLSGGWGDDTVFGGAGNDLMWGDADGGGLYTEHDRLYGEDGDDTIHGQNGNDVIRGDAGNDLIYGGKADDTINGGDGDDQIHGDDAGDSYGSDTIAGGLGDDLIYGGVGHDTIYGQGQNDTIYGGVGWDTLHGQGGNDVLHGDADTDTLIGLTGTDTLYGGDATDYLEGGAGNDTLFGGNGADLFEFANDASGGIDTIADFQDGLDRINLGPSTWSSGDVVIADDGLDTLVTVGGAGGVTIRLTGIDHTLISAFSDFYY